MIYDSASNRPDYAPVLVGNGDMAFAVNAEGTLGYEKLDFPGIKNFWSPYIFRAGHRTGINLHKSINANLLTFGDSLNDLSMLEAAGTGVCMGNARADVKALGFPVCKSNEEDGVARYLEAHVLNQ